ncbi:MAG: hypothetical protein WCI57_04375 [Candidatus Berkelbacteria bacterium]
MAPKTKKRPSKRPIKITVNKARENWREIMTNIEKKQTRYVFSDKEKSIIAVMISEDSYNSLPTLEKFSTRLLKECWLLSSKEIKEFRAIDNTPVRVDFSLEQHTLQELVDDVQESHMRYMIMNTVGSPGAIIIDARVYKALLSYEKLVMKLAEYHANRR